MASGNDKEIGGLEAQMKLVLHHLENIASKVDKVESQTTNTYTRVESLEKFRDEHVAQFQAYLEDYRNTKRIVESVSTIVESMQESNRQQAKTIKWSIGILITIIVSAAPVLYWMFSQGVNTAVNEQLSGYQFEIIE